MKSAVRLLLLVAFLAATLALAEPVPPPAPELTTTTAIKGLDPKSWGNIFRQAAGMAIKAKREQGEKVGLGPREELDTPSIQCLVASYAHVVAGGFKLQFEARRMSAAAQAMATAQADLERFISWWCSSGPTSGAPNKGAEILRELGKSAMHRTSEKSLPERMLAAVGELERKPEWTARDYALVAAMIAAAMAWELVPVP